MINLHASCTLGPMNKVNPLYFLNEITFTKCSSLLTNTSSPREFCAELYFALVEMLKLMMCVV